MNYYINVKFGISNKTYYFATDDQTLEIGDFVVVETIVGLEMAEITTFPKLISTLNYDREIKPILRKATAEDFRAYAYNEELAVEASELFTKSVDDLKLDMRLIGAQYTLDRAKILFTYVADDRVDFRELLKVLASQLHCRIELRQINSRERAQLVGGLGVCGLPLCCTTFFTQFEGVSLSKAKNQMLAINIPKLSGQCGKLMCCLKYEDDLYTEAKKEFPAVNTKVIYDGQEYKIASYNVLSKIVKIVNENDMEFLTLDEINSLLNIKPHQQHKEKQTSLNAKIVYENKEISEEKKQFLNDSKQSGNDKKQSDSKPQNEHPKKENGIDKKESGKNKNQNSTKKQPTQTKNPAKPHKNKEKQVEPTNSNRPMFAGQANKLEAYQETYYKNNKPRDEQQNHHHKSNKKKPHNNMRSNNHHDNQKKESDK